MVEVANLIRNLLIRHVEVCRSKSGELRAHRMKLEAGGLVRGCHCEKKPVDKAC